MFIGHQVHSFNIKLPINTSKEIVEWFQKHEQSNMLSEELIALVSEKIKNEKQVFFQVQESNLKMETNSQFELRNEPFSAAHNLDNLYNWEDSNNAIFTDEIKERKSERKRMLSV